MSRYIRLEDLQKFPIRKDHYDKKNGDEKYVFGVEDVLEYAEYLPTYDVVEVRHGHWLSDNDRPNSARFKCSECGEISYYPQPNTKKDKIGRVCTYKYCPHCNAVMDEKGET